MQLIRTTGIERLEPDALPAGSGRLLPDRPRLPVLAVQRRLAGGIIHESSLALVVLRWFNTEPHSL